MGLKFGEKIKYCLCFSCGREVIVDAYVLEDDGGGKIWISHAEGDLIIGCGATIRRSLIR